MLNFHTDTFSSHPETQQILRVVLVEKYQVECLRKYEAWMIEVILRSMHVLKASETKHLDAGADKTVHATRFARSITSFDNCVYFITRLYCCLLCSYSWLSAQPHRISVSDILFGLMHVGSVPDLAMLSFASGC
jgi:hypothetical protein